MRMKKVFGLLIVVLLAFLFIFAASGKMQEMKEVKAVDPGIKPQSLKSPTALKPDLDFGKIPLYFISNKGQVNEKARFYAKASRYNLWLTKEGLVFDSFKRDKESGVRSKGDLPHSPKLERDVSRLMFVGTNKNPEISAIEPAKLKVNYFIGNDKSKWHGAVPTSMAVLYKSLYKNIDLKVYGIEKQIEYDWIVKPGADPKDIRFKYKNVKGTRIDEDGNLMIETDFGELMHKKPFSYQETDGNKAVVEVEFKKMGKSTYGFAVGGYDKSRDLIIDPVVLPYSTYLGGYTSDLGSGIATYSGKYAYVTGYTNSPNFPTKNQYQPYQGNYDVFVTKLDTTKNGASSLIYSTYLGGSSRDYGKGIAVDGSGNAYVTGYTYSPNFPTKNQYQAYQGGYDVFVTKLDTTKNGASSLIYSTYLGGYSTEYGRGIAVDGSGNAYVVGDTYSPDFPIQNPYQAYYWDGDAFVTKLDTTQSGTSSLIYSTCLGGGERELGLAIAVDLSGDVYVTGRTDSGDFPTINQFQGDQPGRDAFVAKLDTTQGGISSLTYSTYLGGNDTEEGSGIAVDGSGNAYVTGRTRSSNFPTLDQYQTYQGNYDAFVTRIDPTKSGASGLIYSTYLGGGSTDYAMGIAVDSSGNAYVTGRTRSSNFPNLDQYQKYQGNYDAFVTRIDPNQSGASSLLYSTHLGGNSADYGFAIAVDGSGNAYVTGYTYSPNFPTLNGYQDNFAGNIDTFVSKFSFGPTNEPPVAICQGIEIATDENCQAYITAADVDGGSYDPDEGDEITLSLDNSGPFGIGTHYVELTVTDQDGESDSCFAEVIVQDTTAPMITNLSATPNSLWPANHKMVAVTVSVEAADNCDGSTVSKITAVESNEPINGLGDGDTSPDWEITGDLTLNLRAERSGNGSGRVYTITVECSDAAGNTTTGTVTVVVPKNKKK